jgi:hypothetical protein
MVFGRQLHRTGQPALGDCCEQRLTQGCREVGRIALHVGGRMMLMHDSFSVSGLDYALDERRAIWV